MVYTAAVDGEMTVVFCKRGANRLSDPTQFNCHFGWGDLQRSNNKISLTTKAVTTTHVNPKGNPRATMRAGNRGKSRGRFSPLHHTLPSVAKISNSISEVEKKNKKKYDLYMCTMLWNQIPSGNGSSTIPSLGLSVGSSMKTTVTTKSGK